MHRSTKEIIWGLNFNTKIHPEAYMKLLSIEESVSWLFNPNLHPLCLKYNEKAIKGLAKKSKEYVQEYKDKEITSLCYGPIVKNAILYLFEHKQLTELIKKALFLRDNETDEDQLNFEAKTASLSEQEEVLLFALTDKAKAKNSDLWYQIRKEILLASHESRILYKEELSSRLKQHWTRQTELEAKEAEHLETEIELITKQDEEQLVAEKNIKLIMDALKLFSSTLKITQTEAWKNLRNKNRADKESLADQLDVEKDIDTLDESDFSALENGPDHIGHSDLKSNNI